MKYAVYVLWDETAHSREETMIWNVHWHQKSRLLRVSNLKFFFLVINIGSDYTDNLSITVSQLHFFLIICRGRGGN